MTVALADTAADITAIAGLVVDGVFELILGPELAETMLAGGVLMEVVPLHLLAMGSLPGPH